MRYQGDHHRYCSRETGNNKRLFAPSDQLKAWLLQKKEIALAAEIERLANMADISYVMQEERNGLGHAVLMAEKR